MSFLCNINGTPCLVTPTGTACAPVRDWSVMSSPPRNQIYFVQQQQPQPVRVVEVPRHSPPRVVVVERTPPPVAPRASPSDLRDVARSGADYQVGVYPMPSGYAGKRIVCDGCNCQIRDGQMFRNRGNQDLCVSCISKWK